MKRTTERGKTLLRRSVLSLAVFLLFLSVAAPSLAWFSRAIYRSVTGEFKASSILSYFGGGTGKEGDPYLIKSPKHLYNLSWLQNKGVFTDKTYFKLFNDINMAGSNSGTGNETGAIPPIGSKENPFTGVFDGDHHVISNLWVSTLKSDWKEQPEDAVDYSGTHVGMFGGISGGASVSNFNLDRVEVKSHISATVGIVCGYVDASISGVGVYNGILNLSGGKTFSSRYSLLGELTDNVSWSDMPKGEGGGDLVITPSDLKTVAAGSIEAVPNALPGTAYYVGSLTVTNDSGGNAVKMYDMRTGSAKEFTTPDANATNKVAQQKVIDAFKAYNTDGKKYL
ncbi:MAG: hypothetical protein SOT34_04975 [Candidatus Borkfalkiaceae bacterium]|nr:hypothetical protein [Christensenellaceae bacterium]